MEHQPLLVDPQQHMLVAVVVGQIIMRLDNLLLQDQVV
jgi:hypothetical protein